MAIIFIGALAFGISRVVQNPEQYGYDVALRIADIIGKKKALGEIMHITTSETKKWKDILDLYLNIIEEKMGKKPKVYWLDTSINTGKIVGNKYQIKYAT